MPRPAPLWRSLRASHFMRQTPATKLTSLPAPRLSSALPALVSLQDRGAPRCSHPRESGNLLKRHLQSRKPAARIEKRGLKLGPRHDMGCHEIAGRGLTASARRRGLRHGTNFLFRLGPGADRARPARGRQFDLAGQPAHAAWGGAGCLPASPPRRPASDRSTCSSSAEPGCGAYCQAKANDLHEELDKSSVDILSLDVIQKADKIEKLAKKIKDEAKGY